MTDERAAVSTCLNELDPAKYKNKTLNEEEKYGALNNKWVTQNPNCPRRKCGQRLLRYSNKWEDTYPMVETFTDLLKARAQFVWSTESQEAFSVLHQRWLQPVLTVLFVL